MSEIIDSRVQCILETSLSEVSSSSESSSESSQVDSSESSESLSTLESTTSLRRTFRVRHSSLFRDIAEKSDRAEDDLIIEDLSTREWRNKIVMKLEHDLSRVVRTEDWKRETECHREISALYVIDLEDVINTHQMTIAMIRRMLRETMKEHMLHEIFFDFEQTRSFFSLFILSVSLEVSQKSSSKIIKVLSKSERFVLTLKKMLNINISWNQTTKNFEVSRSTLARHFREDRIRMSFAKSRRRLDEVEKKTLCKFIDDYTALEFSSRFHMIEQKIMLLIRLREPDFSSLSKNWLRRFLNRHSDYRDKFSRHLNQKRHLNFNKDVFKI